MTEIVLDKVNHDAELARKIGQAFLILCMIIGLYCSVSLLKWAVNVRVTEADVVATNMVTAEVRERQLGCLAKNIYHEAGSEPFECKVAVAQVTLNRSTSGKFPEDPGLASASFLDCSTSVKYLDQTASSVLISPSLICLTSRKSLKLLNLIFFISPQIYFLCFWTEEKRRRN